jgi:hypothetical protein
MARKRGFSTFSLSFLDIMSCGFGAVALIFLIIKHDVDNRIEVEHQDLTAEINLLDEDITDGQEGLVRARNTLSALDQRLAEAKGLARRITQQVETTRAAIADVSSEDSETEIKRLKEEIQKLASQKKELESQREQGNDVRRYVGQGNRQYLTGINLGGSHILILLDASASMLDESIVNIIRRRNMSNDVKRTAAKWQRALSTVDWITAQMPQQSRYQIYTFNTKIEAALSDTQGQWLNVNDAAELEQSVLNLRKRIPENGTNLEQVFASVAELNPMPDNIFLITDGLPTQGAGKSKKAKISGIDRVKLFNSAVDILPKGIPVNVILAPMEGDPMAAAAFWQLAQITDGAFISPSKDWP